jgi:hypothetical protein
MRAKKRFAFPRILESNRDLDRQVIQRRFVVGGESAVVFFFLLERTHQHVLAIE